MKKQDGNSTTPRRARLSDVAREAAVSLGAASKALSQPDAVRPKTLAAVRRAVEKLGYIPSDSGRALASRYTRMVGVVLPTIDNPVYATFVQVLQNTLSAEDHQLLALSHEYDREREVAIVERLVGRGVDAFVLMGSSHDDRTIGRLQKLKLPHVLAWSSDEAPTHGSVGISNRHAMRKPIDHLAELGHRCVGILVGDPEHNERSKWRLQGAREAIRRNGMQLVAVETVPLTIDGGRTGFQALDPLGKSITALVCVTDILAAGALDAARQAGISVPGQLSVTGFDDIELASLMTPPLTTVRVPIAQMAIRTGEALLEMLRGGAVPKSYTLKTQFFVRGSTGPAAN